MRELLREQWEDYCQHVYHQQLTGEQLIECRRCFFAGAKAFERIFMAMADPGEEPTESDEDLLLALRTEMEQFRVDVVGGRK